MNEQINKYVRTYVYNTYTKACTRATYTHTRARAQMQTSM